MSKRTEALQRAHKLCGEAAQSLERALAREARPHKVLPASLSLGAAKSYLEEAYGLLDQLDEPITVPEGQSPDEEGFKA